MLKIGTQARNISNDPSKTAENLENSYMTMSKSNLPAQEDLISVLGAETMSLEEHLSFYTPPDILLEDELSWPVKPENEY
jgi:hypothetical protein